MHFNMKIVLKKHVSQVAAGCNASRRDWSLRVSDTELMQFYVVQKVKATKWTNCILGLVLNSTWPLVFFSLLWCLCSILTVHVFARQQEWRSAKTPKEKNPLYMDLYEGLKASSTFLPFKSLPTVTRKGNVCIGLKGGVKDWLAESGLFI